MALKKTVRNSLISIVVLIALFLAAGTAYTLFLGQANPKQTATPAPQPASTPTEIKPTPPAPNAPVGVSVDSLLSPVSAGSNTSIAVKTTAGANCTISVVYNGVASTDSGLAPKTADAYGLDSWTWTVGATVPPGSWPVKVTCAYKGKSGVVQQNLQVTR